MPGSPEISTTRPSPLFACSQRRSSSSTSSSRPTSGVSPERNASKRLTTPLSPNTRQARCGSANPASRCAVRDPRARTTRQSAVVCSLQMTTVFGAASACSRAARFGVSPTTVCCLRRALADQIADDHQPGGDPDPHPQRGRSTLAIGRPHRSPQVQPRTARSASSLMRSRLAEVDQHAIADMYLATKPSNRAIVDATRVIAADQLTQILWIKTRR